MGLVTSQPVGGGAKAPLFRVRERREGRDRIDILDNALATEDPRLARALEQELVRLLKDEDVGPVQVRFRVCREEPARLRFVCKVENPPFDGEDGRVQWRWWSPLMETAEEFRGALQDGLRMRRERLAAWRPRPVAE
jgi:hypothetical protein